MAHNERLFKALEHFAKAACNLTSEWTQEEFNGENPPQLTEGYPFDESFHEVHLKILNWYSKQNEIHLQEMAKP